MIELHDYKPSSALGDEELLVLMSELKSDLNAYLATTPGAVRTRTLAEVIEFDRATPRETVLFGQDLFEKAEATAGTSDPAYRKARQDALRGRAPRASMLIAENRPDALIAPSFGRRAGSIS